MLVVPTGSKIDPKRTWQVPVCARWGVGKTTGRDCTTLGAATGELALSAPSCPDWVLPNDGEVGCCSRRSRRSCAGGRRLLDCGRVRSCGQLD
jgi:hypothetical protein